VEDSEYTNGEYLKKNPTWHSEDSPFKARQILKMFEKRAIVPRTICEIGCGAGGILRALHDAMPATCSFAGYEMSPQAFAMTTANHKPRLSFHCGDITMAKDVTYDVILVMDVIEHIEDYFTFLRRIKGFGKLMICHIPLDISVQGVMRNSLLRGWNDVGHIHSFTKDVALKAIRHCGYEVEDYFYTSRSEIAFNHLNLALASIPRGIAFSIHQDLAVRVLGGYSLLVLAR
jgi:Methyltransferase domain